MEDKFTVKQKNKRVIRKPVAFNRNDVDQEKLLEYVMRVDNFSGYMKNLILEDMRRQAIQSTGIKIKI